MHITGKVARATRLIYMYRHSVLKKDLDLIQEKFECSLASIMRSKFDSRTLKILLQWRNVHAYTALIYAMSICLPFLCVRAKHNRTTLCGFLWAAMIPWSSLPHRLHPSLAMWLTPLPIGITACQSSASLKEGTNWDNFSYLPVYIAVSGINGNISASSKKPTYYRTTGMYIQNYSPNCH